MSHGPFLRSLREYGLRGTFEKLYKMRTIKFGRLIGVDRFGNQYFENTADYPHGVFTATYAAAATSSSTRERCLGCPE